VTELTPEAETFIRFRLDQMGERNEHHRFEDIATRIARKRISSNILIATGPVSAGGDQQRDAESYTTRIPEELPHSAGFSATASTLPVVLACSIQRDGLKAKVQADVAGIGAANAAPVSHIAFFSVHPIPTGTVHKLQEAAREMHGVTLDVFSGGAIATLLAEPDLIWVARHYLELPASMVPPPEGEQAPQWYADLLESLRQNHGPEALTPGAQGEIMRGLRYATWDADTNGDLPEWIDFMGSFLTESNESRNSEVAFRACYEMAVARFRGMGLGVGAEDLVRRALEYAYGSDRPNVLDDAATLLSYWGVMWTTGVGRAEASEIGAALARLKQHVSDELQVIDPATHPIQSASLTGTMAFLHFIPNWLRAEELQGRPEPVDVAPHAVEKFEDTPINASVLADGLVDIESAMTYMERLVALLPTARPYSVRQLSKIFAMFAPSLVGLPNYAAVRDGLDEATAAVQGEAAIAQRCRERGTTFAQAEMPLEALSELHTAKVNWFHGDTMYGAVLTMRYIGHLYSTLGLTYAAKMYACSAATMANASPDPDVKAQTAKALLEAAKYAQSTGHWLDAAALTEIALLARYSLLTDPFDYDKYPELADHELNATLELVAIRKYWPHLEQLIQTAHDRTEWFDNLIENAKQPEVELQIDEDEFQTLASDQFSGPILGDVGPTRIIDFCALGVRWTLTFNNDRITVLTAEGFCGVLQVLLADIARHHPVIINSTVNIQIDVVPDAPRKGVDNIDIDEDEPEIRAHLVLSNAIDDLNDRDQSLVAMAFQLLHAVHVRPPDDLQELLEPLFKEGLPHKISIGRPYEQAADLISSDHYDRCATRSRTASSSRFDPVENNFLAASTQPGTGYDRDAALQVIRERYEVAASTLKYSLPRLLRDASARATIQRLRGDGWLDWQILVTLVNAAWNWRMQQAGINVATANRHETMKLARLPETKTSPLIPLDVLVGDRLDVFLNIQAITVAQRWDLRPRQEKPGEEAMRDLLTRRYGYAIDDVPHTDLLDCISDGDLVPFVEES